MDRGAWQATVHGVTRVRHDLASKPPTFVTGYSSLDFKSHILCITECHHLPVPWQ